MWLDSRSTLHCHRDHGAGTLTVKVQPKKRYEYCVYTVTG